MEQNLKVDAIAFILRTSLQMVHSRVKTLRNFLKAIDHKPEKEDQS